MIFVSILTLPPKKRKKMEGCSTLLIIRKQQVKITMRYHLSLVRMVILKGLQTVKEGDSLKKMEGSYPVLGKVIGNTQDK